MYDAELEAKKLFDDLSDEELMHLLQESGFGVTKGNGGVVYSEDNNMKYVSSVSGRVSMKFIPHNLSSFKSTKIKSFPSMS